MLPLPAGRDASPGIGAFVYERHRPERTLLYQLVEQYFPAFKAHLAGQGTALPGYVEQEFEDYLKCGRLEHGFLRVRCDSCHAEHLLAFSCKRRGFCPSCGARRMAESAALLVDEVFPEQPVRQWVLSVPYPLRFLFASRPAVMGRVLGIAYRCIATHLLKKAGFSRKTAHPGAVTLIQRFGSALNLNIHFHMLFLDGVYAERPNGTLRFRWVKAPTRAELSRLTQTLALRIGRYLERQGLLERDAENSYLAADGFEAEPMAQLRGSSITYRIAVGPQQADLLRSLLIQQRVLSLAVVADDRPVIGLLPFALSADGRALIVHASRLARHTAGLAEGAPFDAWVHEPITGDVDLLQMRWLPLRGEVRAFAEHDAARATYLAKFPEAEPITALGDFAFFRLEITGGRLVSGFGGAVNLSSRTLPSLLAVSMPS